MLIRLGPFVVPGAHRRAGLWCPLGGHETHFERDYYSSQLDVAHSHPCPLLGKMGWEEEG